MEEPIEASQIIRRINKGVVHRICSGQVILDLSSAVKELVENSLDGGATSIEIALRDYGQDSFQVIDNGSGISPNNFKVLALKHHTSKLSGFPDLQSLATFGFRGEALSSLCALGGLTVETRTKNEPVATHLTFDHSGSLIAEKKIARQIGTTVTVKKLFSNLPVRSKEFRRNIRKEYGKLITLLNAYALIAKGVRLICTNTSGKSSRSVVLKTQGTDSLKDNIITVFGMSTYSCLEPISMCISDDCKIDGFLSKPGYGSGRNLGDRQFFFVNGRPVDMPKVSKLVNELYRGANSKQYPIVIINFKLPTTSCDVNVTPDKRKVFFSDEGSLLQSLRGVLENIYSPDRASYQVNKLEELQKGDHTKNTKLSSVDASDSDQEVCCKEQDSESMASLSTKDSPASLDIRDNEDRIEGKDLLRSPRWKKELDVSRSPSSGTGNLSVRSSRLLEEGVSDSLRSPAHSSTIQSSLTKFVTYNKRKHESISTTLSEVPLLRNGYSLCQLGDEEIAKKSALTFSPCNYIKVNDKDETNNERFGVSKFSRFTEAILKRDFIPSFSSNLQNRELREDDEKEALHVSESVSESPKNIQDIPKDLSDAVPVRRSPLSSSNFPVDTSRRSPGSTLQFSFQDLKTRRQQRLSRLQMVNTASRRMNNGTYFTAATIELSQMATEEGKENALAAATSELERLFRKEDFRQMKVIGQFNLGFIVGKVGEDLFIVDQHAADEKYNYEHLSQSTVLNQQPLLCSLRLELSPEEEIVVSMHMDIIRRNGFSLEEDQHAPPGQRFKLKAVPFSKNTTFGVEDLKELISIVADGHGECSMIGSYRLDTADSVCPPRVRAMLASRACRSSVMIGDPLGRNEMQKILKHLADLKSPWNCPHGRPTMRHLVDLRTTRRCMDMDDDETIKL
ncbi:hypothetical protein Leryth_009018 [Lithospermum erythrorhizon]|nr:hypothetical protein Leryth_009018 [Lithospermum erythrorhizon]